MTFSADTQGDCPASALLCLLWYRRLAGFTAALDWYKAGAIDAEGCSQRQHIAILLQAKFSNVVQEFSHHWSLVWAVNAGCSAATIGREGHSEAGHHTIRSVPRLCRYSATIGAEGSSKKQHITNLLQQIFPEGITPLADKVARLERREAVWNARLGRFTGTVSCWSGLECVLLIPFSPEQDISEALWCPWLTSLCSRAGCWFSYSHVLHMCWTWPAWGTLVRAPQSVCSFDYTNQRPCNNDVHKDHVDCQQLAVQCIALCYGSGMQHSGA